MKKLNPVPISNWVYENNTQAPCTLILLDVQPSAQPNEYDVYVIFRGYAGIYRFVICITVHEPMRCKIVSVGGFNSLALKLARNGLLKIESHKKNPYRVRLTFTNSEGFHASILMPKISVMPFFYEQPKIS